MNKAGVPSTEGRALASGGHLNKYGSVSVTGREFRGLVQSRDYNKEKKKKGKKRDVSNNFGRKGRGGKSEYHAKLMAWSAMLLGL